MDQISVYWVLFECQSSPTSSKVLSDVAVIKRHHNLPSWLQSDSIKSNSVVRIVEFFQKVESFPEEPDFGSPVVENIFSKTQKFHLVQRVNGD